MLKKISFLLTALVAIFSLNFTSTAQEQNNNSPQISLIPSKICSGKSAIYISGTFHSYGTGEDHAWIWKLDKDGKILWKGKYKVSSRENVMDVACLDDFIFLLISGKGPLSCNTRMLKLSSKDSRELDNWAKNNIFGTAFSVNPGKSLIMAGSVMKNQSGSGQADGWAACFNSDFKTLWTKQYPKKRTETIISLSRVINGRCALLLYSSENFLEKDSASEIFVLICDENGNKIKEKKVSNSIFPVSTGNYTAWNGNALALIYPHTQTDSLDDAATICVKTLDPELNTIWESELKGYSVYQAFSVIATEDGNFIMNASLMDGSPATRKITPDGKIIWKNVYKKDNTNSFLSCSLAGISCLEGNLFIAGNVSNLTSISPVKHVFIVDLDSKSGKFKWHKTY